ncbi:MAG: DUF3025 domain-containing protein [Pseudomonadota bacterium]
MLAAEEGRPVTDRGLPVSFVADAAAEGGYEARIAATGRVATRDENWHDLFNALVWLRYPRIKAAMNARHCTEIENRPVGDRGPVRDALTQFDEDGLVLVTDDATLIDALRSHRWREALFERRGAVERATLHAIGHALMEKALTPHFGLCAKALYLHADEVPTDTETLDGWLAARIADGRWPQSPRDLKPLPVLGLPGMTSANIDPAYFDDTRQFRPLPAMRQ